MQLRGVVVLGIATLCGSSCYEAPKANGGSASAADSSSSEGSATGATASASNPTMSASDPSATASNPTASASDPTTSASDPTASASDPTTSASDPTETSATEASATDPDTGSSTGETNPTTSEGPVDAEPPTLEFGAFVDASTIRLTFSEPIDSVAGVNPAKFRPSLGWWDSDDSGQVYLDLLHDFPDQNCPCITASALQNDPVDEYSVLVTLSGPATAQTCENIDFNYLPVMHYDADTLGSAQHIRDLAGNELAEMGGQFVENPGLSQLTIPADSPYPDFPYAPPMLDDNVICP